MRLVRLLALAFVAMVAVPASAQAVCQTNWNNPAGGSWHNNANWTDGDADPNNNTPDSGDTACIELPGSYTVTITNNASTTGLTLGDGNTGNGSPTLQITGTTVAGNTPSGHSLGIGNSSILQDGVLELTTSGANPGGSTLTMNSGTTTLTNAGVVRTVPGPGTTFDRRVLNGRYVNTPTGRFEINDSVNINTANAPAGNILSFVNQGSISVANGENFAILGPGAGVVFTQDGGTVSTAGTGVLTQYSGTHTHVSGGNSGNPIQLCAAALNASGSGNATFDIIYVPGNCNVGLLSGDIAAGKTVRVVGSAGNVLGAAITTPITNNGTLTLTGPGETQLQSSQLTNNGTLRVEGGGVRSISSRLTNGPSGTTQILTNTTCPCNGLTFTNEGNFAIAPGASLVMSGATTFNQNGGTLSGGGLTASTLNNNGGIVAPGASPGVFSLTGDYAQGPGGTLAIEIAGAAPGSGYDQLAVSGAATLAGTLAVSTSGFSPTTGQTFDVLSAKSRAGTFGSLASASPFDVGYSATGVQLTARSGGGGDGGGGGGGGGDAACDKAKDKLEKAKKKLKKLKEKDAPKDKIKKAKKKVKKAKKAVKEAC